MNNNTQEIWMTIDEYDNYQVSCFGRIRNINTLKIMKQGLNTTGYYKIDLYKNKIRKTHTVHRLIAFAFCHNDNDYPLVDHIDRNPLNNHFLNLRWATESMNMKNASTPSNNDNESNSKCKRFSVQKIRRSSKTNGDKSSFTNGSVIWLFITIYRIFFNNN